MLDTSLLPQIAAALIALTAVLIAVRILRRGGPQDSPPAPGSALAGLGNVRLRDLYRLAILLEEEGVAFYLKLAELAFDPATRGLCAKLADEETEHMRRFQDALSRWRQLPPNKVEWPELLARVKLEGLFAAPPGPRASEREMAAFAIEQERRTVKFYRMFEDAFPEAWKKEKLRELVDEEMSHEIKLRKAYPDIV